MNVKIIYDEKIKLGSSAVTIQGKYPFVYIVNDDIAEKRILK